MPILTRLVAYIYCIINSAKLTFENDVSGIITLGGDNCKTLAPLAQCIVGGFPNFMENSNSSLPIQGIVTSSQSLNIIVTSSEFNSYGKSVPATTQSGIQLIAPLILKNAFGGFNTSLTVFNTSPVPVTATIQYYDQNGSLDPTLTANLSLFPYGGYDSVTSLSSLPDNFVGWAQISGLPGSNLVAQVVESNSNGFSTAFSAQVVGSSTLYASTIFSSAFGGYNTGASIVNPNSNSVTVTLNYYDNNGKALPPATFTMQPHALTSIYQGNTQGKSGIVGIPDGGLPNGFYGSATITSQGGGVAMLVNEIGPASSSVVASGSYTARPSGMSQLVLPIICNGGYGYTTGLTLLNTSNISVNATLQYYNPDGTPLKRANGTAVTANFSVAAHGSYPIYQGAAGLPGNFYGLAVVTSTSGPANSLIATTNAISSSNFYTYTEPQM